MKSMGCPSLCPLHTQPMRSHPAPGTFVAKGSGLGEMQSACSARSVLHPNWEQMFPAWLGFPCWLRANLPELPLCLPLPRAAPGPSWTAASVGQSPWDIQLLEGAAEQGEEQGGSRAQPLLDIRESPSLPAAPEMSGTCQPFPLPQAQPQQPRA